MMHKFVLIAALIGLLVSTADCQKKVLMRGDRWPVPAQEETQVPEGLFVSLRKALAKQRADERMTGSSFGSPEETEAPEGLFVALRKALAKQRADERITGSSFGSPEETGAPEGLFVALERDMARRGRNGARIARGGNGRAAVRQPAPAPARRRAVRELLVKLIQAGVVEPIQAFELVREFS